MDTSEIDTSAMDTSAMDTSAADTPAKPIPVKAEKAKTPAKAEKAEKAKTPAKAEKAEKEVSFSSLIRFQKGFFVHEILSAIPYDCLANSSFLPFHFFFSFSSWNSNCKVKIFWEGQKKLELSST